mmetsp:Transcript_144281/g.447978  ORF Transcript_144281/g.447978 Transcript_144281/m.447978 type:complete len:303 (+) Transcript_144281:722-1630(+)
MAPVQRRFGLRRHRGGADRQVSLQGREADHEIAPAAEEHHRHGLRLVRVLQLAVVRCSPLPSPGHVAGDHCGPLCDGCCLGAHLHIGQGSGPGRDGQGDRQRLRRRDQGDRRAHRLLLGEGLRHGCGGLRGLHIHCEVPAPPHHQARPRGSPRPPCRARMALAHPAVRPGIRGGRGGGGIGGGAGRGGDPRRGWQPACGCRLTCQAPAGQKATGPPEVPQHRRDRHANAEEEVRGLQGPDLPAGAVARTGRRRAAGGGSRPGAGARGPPGRGGAPRRPRRRGSRPGAGGRGPPGRGRAPRRP